MTASVLSDLGASNSVIPTKTLKSLASTVYVNSFYDGVKATGPTNVSRPLGTGTGNLGYATLAAAQVDYPAATALTDEVDWCVWQGASNSIYTRDVVGSENISKGHIQGDGLYLVNKTITLNHVAICISGIPGSTRYYGTKVQYNGSGGTIDAPVSVFDCYGYDEFGVAPPGRVSTAGSATDPKFMFRDINIWGLNGGNSSTVQSAGHGYVWGIRIRQAAFCQVENCSLDARLYDGIVFTAPQLFVIINKNWFGNVARDGISNVRALPGNNSTTIWIYNNEFIGCDRYGIFLDFSGGAVEGMPVIRDNSFEHSNTNSFYYNHPEWYVSGVVAWECFINCTLLYYDGNRHEGGTLTTNYYGELHIVNCQAAKISHNTFSAMFISDNTGPTSAFSTFYNGGSAHNWSDITDQRNYNINSTGTPGNRTENLLIEHNYNSGLIYYPDGEGGASTTANLVRGQGLMVMGVPTQAGTYAQIAVGRDAAQPTLLDGLGFQRLDTVSHLSPAGIKNVSSGGGSVDDYQWLDLPYGAWAANTSFTGFDKATVGGYVFRRPTTPNETGFFYQVASTTGDGKTHATTEPTWPTTIGSTVVDNHVTWKCVGVKALDADINAGEISKFGKRERAGTAAPTTGRWAVGDKIINSAPSAGGTDHWVCTTAGVPGTWKAVVIAA